MENKKEVAMFTREQFIEPKNFTELLEASKILVSSKILPKEIDTPEKCAVVILTGRELGLRMMAATRGIYIVNGKSALSSQMMMALALQTGEVEDYAITESGKGETASCSVRLKRKGMSEYTYSFSVDMAKKMQKYQNEWLKQPENMCKQRAIAGNLRVTFPDAILGMYTPEEIESVVTVETFVGKPHVDMPREKIGTATLSPEQDPQELTIEPVQETEARIKAEKELAAIKAKIVDKREDFVEKYSEEQFITFLGREGYLSIDEIPDTAAAVVVLNSLLKHFNPAPARKER